MAHVVSRNITAVLFERISDTFHALSERAERHSIYRTTLRELNRLSDRELTDLGLHRSMIKSTAYESAYNN